MPQTFAKLFCNLVTLEDTFGLSELRPVERAVFRFISEQVAAGKMVSTSDVVALEIAHRSSIYRHLETLESRDLICRIPNIDGAELVLHPRLANNQELIAELLTLASQATASGSRWGQQVEPKARRQ